MYVCKYICMYVCMYLCMHSECMHGEELCNKDMDCVCMNGVEDGMHVWSMHRLY